MASQKLLELEYGYIQTLLTQTIEDRYRFLNFYIGLSAGVATLVAGFASFSELNSVFIGFLALGMCIVGIIFFLMMIRIRQAWFESAMALNKLKSGIAGEAFSTFSFIDFTNDNLPAIDRLWNIHFCSTLLICLLCNAYGVASLIIFLQFVSAITSILIGDTVFAGLLAIEIILYKLLLRAGW